MEAIHTPLEIKLDKIITEAERLILVSVSHRRQSLISDHNLKAKIREALDEAQTATIEATRQHLKPLNNGA